MLYSQIRTFRPDFELVEYQNRYRTEKVQTSYENKVAFSRKCSILKLSDIDSSYLCSKTEVG